MTETRDALRTGVDRLSMLAVLIALVAIAFQTTMPTKDDISWLITNAEALLNGKQLYKDIIETNPPLSIFLYVPAVLTERLIGLRAELASIMITALLGLLVGRFSRRRFELAGVDGGGRFEVAVVLVFLLLPLGAYGQKDLVAALIAVPFCVELALRADGRCKMSVSAGVLLGLAMAIKPQFSMAALLPCLGMAIRSWRKGESRWPSFIFNRATVTAGLFVLVFEAAIYWLFPAFFKDVMPMVLEVYAPPRQPIFNLLFSLNGFLFPVLFILPLLYGPRTTLTGVIAAAGLGFFAAFLLQGKGWPYHLFPATSYGFLLIFAEVLPPIWAQRKQRSPAIPVLMVFAILMPHALWMMVTWTDWSALTRAITTTGIHNPTVLNIAASQGIGHPSTRDAGGKWVGTFSCRWLTVLEMNASQKAAEGLKDKAISAWITHDRAVLRQDIAERKPDIIIVDRRDFDWLKWAREDFDTARLLEAYEPSGEVTEYGEAGSIELLRRSGVH